MIHNCHTCMGRPPLVMMINSDFHKGWLGDNKAHFSDGWTWAAWQALCLRSSLSDRSSSTLRNVQGEAIGRWGFVSASHQNKPVCPLHCLAFLSSFFPCQLLPVHDLSGVADFEAVCTWTAEGAATQKGQYLAKADCQEKFHASDTRQTESKPVLHGSVCGDWLRCLPLSLCTCAWQAKKALFKSNMEAIGNCQPCNCGFKACSLEWFGPSVTRYCSMVIKKWLQSLIVFYCAGFLVQPAD